ncbi:unnamed protein product [Discosporangium mesarthrocarpum]
MRTQAQLFRRQNPRKPPSGLHDRAGGRGQSQKLEHATDQEQSLEVNPFKKQDEEQLLKLRTHNRRRWSHVFPPGELEFKPMPGPIWKSLCQPAILPLTTDYVPSSQALRNRYNNTNYTVLPYEEGHSDSNSNACSELDLLEEMVCQRLAQDFQLVEKGSGSQGPEGLSGGEEGLSDPYMPRSTLTSAKSASSLFAPKKGSRLVNTLSMGHRVHTLFYNETSELVEVKRYVSSDGLNTFDNQVVYKFSLWLPQMGHMQTVRQTFYKYPNPEYTWNYMDVLVKGLLFKGDIEREELTEETKYRRVLFEIIPKKVTKSDEEDTFLRAMKQLENFLNSKGAKGSRSLSFHFKKVFKPTNSACDSGSGSKVTQACQDKPSDKVEYMGGKGQQGEVSADQCTGKDHGNEPRQNADIQSKVDDKGREVQEEIEEDVGDDVETEDQYLMIDLNPAGGLTVMGSPNPGDKMTTGSNGQRARQARRFQSIQVVTDKTVSVKRITHLDVRWLVCSGARVTKFVETLKRHAGNLELNIVQVPECVRGLITVHPLVTHSYLEVESAAVRAIVEEKLCSELDYVRDADVHTDWKEFGVESLVPDVAAPLQPFRSPASSPMLSPAPAPSSSPRPSGLTITLEAQAAAKSSGAESRGQRRAEAKAATLGGSGACKGTGGERPNSARDRAYGHRTGKGFVRVAPKGFVFIHNFHAPYYTPCQAMADPTPKLLKELKELVEVIKAMVNNMIEHDEPLETL